jgi:two-component system phosphate regulon response regulator PhoB
LPTSGLKRQNTVILLVEDDKQTRELYRHAIKAAGYDVAAVEDGLAALRRIDIERPDAIVLDLVLPRLGGVDVFQELRANPDTTKIPVIAVTGADRFLDVDTMAFHYFLRKPVSPEVLVATIDKALSRSPSIE